MLQPSNARPSGYAQILALGDYHDYLVPTGEIDEARWQAHLGLVVVDFPDVLPLSFGKIGTVARAIRCHPIAADAFRSAFTDIYKRGLWPLLHTFGGGYSFRLQRGSKGKLSTHAWGLAGDFDVLNNQLGDRPKMDLEIVQIFEQYGFEWGGRWGRPDGMHFQWAVGY